MVTDIFFRKTHKWSEGILTRWYIFTWFDINKHLHAADTDISHILKRLRLSNPEKKSYTIAFERVLN